jgi:hypothetical protein
VIVAVTVEGVHWESVWGISILGGSWGA